MGMASKQGLAKAHSSVMPCGSHTVDTHGLWEWAEPDLAW